MQIQKQKQIQKVVFTTFSCIAYLRELFDEKNFDNVKFGSSTIKKIRENQTTNSLLRLIESGINKAIDNKYISKFIVAIYLDPNTPEDIVESYSFDIQYEKSNKEEMNENIKKFCLALQRLEPLPAEKYVTIKLIYNDNAPCDYQPMGFKSGEDHNFLYRNESIRLEAAVNSCIVPKELYTTKKTTFDSSKKNLSSEKDNDNNLVSLKNNKVNDSIYIENENILGNNNLQTRQMTKDSHNTNPEVDKVTNSHNISIDDVELKNLASIAEDETKIRCFCLCSSKEFDLLYCDLCNNWLHTTCCGFFSNSDKRIPKGDYRCIYCNNEYTKKSTELALFRRLLSIIYNEEIQNKVWLTNRMGIDKNKMNFLLKKLKCEGFLEYVFSTKKYSVIKNPSTKKKIKEYFRIRRKTSIPIEDINCILQKQ